MADRQNQNRQPTAESHASVNIQYRRSLTRKDPLTGKSNYPTLVTVKATTINYINNMRRTVTRNYRKLIPSVNH